MTNKKTNKLVRELIKKTIKENIHGFPHIYGVSEGMSPEEWVDAKEKERLNQHPEKDTINKIKKMVDKEKEEMHDDPGDIRIDHDYYANESEVSEVDFIDDEGSHAKMQLQKATEYSAKLAVMMDDIKQLPSWIQAKITKASDYMSSVYHYLDYETTEDQEEYDKGGYGESLKESGPSNNPYFNALVIKAKEMGIHVNDLMKSLLKDKSEMEIVKMGYQDLAALAGVEDLAETDAISTARALRPGGEEEDQQVDKDAVDNEYEDLYNSMLDRDHNDFNDSSLEEISRELGYLGEGEGIEVSLEDLTLDLLKSTFPDHYKDVHFTRMQPNGEEGPYYRDAISLPNADDTMRGVGDESALKDWKQEIFDRFGDVNISLNPSADKWFDKVKITNDDFKTSQDVFIKGKKSFIDKETMAGRSID